MTASSAGTGSDLDRIRQDAKAAHGSGQTRDNPRAGVQALSRPRRAAPWRGSQAYGPQDLLRTSRRQDVCSSEFKTQVHLASTQGDVHYEPRGRGQRPKPSAPRSTSRSNQLAQSDQGHRPGARCSCDELSPRQPATRASLQSIMEQEGDPPPIRTPSTPHRYRLAVRANRQRKAADESNGSPTCKGRHETLGRARSRRSRGKQAKVRPPASPEHDLLQAARHQRRKRTAGAARADGERGPRLEGRHDPGRRGGRTQGPRRGGARVRGLTNKRPRYTKGKGERLTGADGPVDRAVKAILGPGTEASRASCRSLANEISNRIDVAADGRLPYDAPPAVPRWAFAASGNARLAQRARLRYPDPRASWTSSTPTRSTSSRPICARSSPTCI